MSKAEGSQHRGRAPRHRAGSLGAELIPLLRALVGRDSRPRSAPVLSSLVGKVWVCTHDTMPHRGAQAEGTDPWKQVLSPPSWRL